MTDPTVRAAERLEPLVVETSEGAQGLQRREATPASELSREVGSVLRVDGHAFDPSSVDYERRDDQTMIINMGPSHPSTHGVLRIMLELDGEGLESLGRAYGRLAHRGPGASLNCTGTRPTA